MLIRRVPLYFLGAIVLVASLLGLGRADAHATPIPMATPTPDGGEGPESEEAPQADTIVDDLLAPRPCTLYPQTPTLHGGPSGSAWIDCGRTTLTDGVFHICLELNGILVEASCESYPMTGQSREDGYAAFYCKNGAWRTHASLHYLGQTYIKRSGTLNLSSCLV